MTKWYETKVNDVDIVDATNWNEQATEILRISGSYNTHSGNKDIHFPSSQLTSWLDMIYQLSGSSEVDSSWSGATGFYGFSSNTKLNITSLFSTSSSFDSRLDNLEDNDEFIYENYITSSNAINRFVESGGTKWTGLTDGGETDLHTHAGMTTDVAWSGATEFYAFSSNVKTDITNLYNTSSSLNSRIETLEGYDVFDSELYITSTSAIDRFADSSSIQTKLSNKQDTLTGSEYYPSSLGNSLSGSYHDHISDTSIHYSKDSISIEDLSDDAVMTPTDGKALIWDDTQSKWSSQTVSASDVAWSGASSFYGFSSNTQSLYHPSGLVISGQEYSQAYASAQRVKDLFDSTLYSLSSNLYNQIWIDSLSGNINSRLEDLEDNDEFVSENYIFSSTAIGRFADSSNYSTHKGDSTIHFTKESLNNNYYPSSLGKSKFIGLFNTSSAHNTRISNLESADSPSKWSGATDYYNFSSAIDSRVDSLYDWSSNALNLYGASSHIHNYQSPISWITVQDGNGIQDFEFKASGTGTKTIQLDFGRTETTVASGSHTHDDRYYTETEIDNNFYTQTWIDTLSGSIDDRLEALEGASEITWLSLETLSSNATDAYNWVNTSSQRYESILASGNEYSINYTWYNTNHTGLDSLLASGNEYSSAYASTSTGVFALATHSHGEFEAWSGATGYTTVSSMVNVLDTWYDNSSQKLSSWYGSGGLLGTAYNHSQDNTQAHSDYLLNNADDTTTGVLTAAGFTTMAGISSNKISSNTICGIAPMTYSIANICLSANQNINLCRMRCPTGKKAYIYQANACGSGGTGIGDLYVEVLADSSLPLYGADTLYKTSSAELQQGNPLASSDAGDYIEVRFMYSGNTAIPDAGAGYKYGTCSIQIGVN